jgi:hypothetical protein
VAFFFIVYFFGETGDFAQVLYYLTHTSGPFCSGYFGDGVLQTICSGWPQTVILPILASQVARITGMTHHA